MTISAKRRLDNHTTGLELTCHSVPEGMELFSIEKEGSVRLEIIPYLVPEGSNNPFADPGQLWYERTYFNHARIGANGDSYICSAKTYGKPCPVCEERTRISREEERTEAVDKLIKSLSSKERQLWYVYDHAAPDKGVQLWEISHHLFGKILDTQTRSADPGDNWEFFADPEQGFTVKATFSEERFGDIKFYKCSVIDFKRREAGSETMIRKLMASITTPLDSLLKEMPYARLKGIFMQSGEPKDEPKTEEKEEPKKKKTEENVHTGETYVPDKKPAKAAEKPTEKAAPAATGGWVAGSEVEHQEYGTCTVFKVNADGTATLMDSEDTPIKNVPPPKAKAAKAEQKEASGPQLKAGDELLFAENNEYGAPAGACRVHKVKDDEVVVINDDADIAKIPLAAAQAARVAALGADKATKGKAKEPEAKEEKKPAKKSEEKETAKDAEPESWDSDWDD